MLRMLPALPMLSIEPALPMLRIDPALPMDRSEPALPMLSTLPTLRMLPTLQKLKTLNGLLTLSRLARLPVLRGARPRLRLECVDLPKSDSSVLDTSSLFNPYAKSLAAWPTVLPHCTRTETRIRRRPLLQRRAVTKDEPLR
jgi:hypothetical protein